MYTGLSVLLPHKSHSYIFIMSSLLWYRGTIQQVYLTGYTKSKGLNRFTLVATLKGITQVTNEVIRQSVYYSPMTNLLICLTSFLFSLYLGQVQHKTGNACNRSTF